MVIGSSLSSTRIRESSYANGHSAARLQDEQVADRSDRQGKRGSDAQQRDGHPEVSRNQVPRKGIQHKAETKGRMGWLLKLRIMTTKGFRLYNQ